MHLHDTTTNARGGANQNTGHDHATTHTYHNRCICTPNGTTTRVLPLLQYACAQRRETSRSHHASAPSLHWSTPSSLLSVPFPIWRSHETNSYSGPPQPPTSFPTDSYKSCPTMAVATLVSYGHPWPGSATLTTYPQYSRVRETRRIHTRRPREITASLDTHRTTFD